MAKESFKHEKLKYAQAADLFKVTIEGKFAALNLLEENIDILAENIYGSLIDRASEILDKARKKKIRMTMTNYILDLCGRKRSRKKRWPCGNAEIQRSQSRNQKKNEAGKGIQDHKLMSRN